LPRKLVQGFGTRHLCRLPFTLPAQRSLGARPERDALSDAMQPATDRLLLADRGSPADEDEERGLEGVLGVVGVAQHPPADTQDHRAVAAHEGLEGALIAAQRKNLQELPIGGALVPQAGSPQVLEEFGDRRGRHEKPPVG
jgi:hypothetical protein